MKCKGVPQWGDSIAELKSTAHPCAHALLCSLWDSDKLTSLDFLALRRQKVNIFCIPVFEFFISYSICTKIAWQWEQPWQEMSNTDCLEAKGSPTAEATAWEQLLTRCTCLAQSWHWVEGAEPQWHNPSVLLKSVPLTPPYACRHLRCWIIMAANQEVMGCIFLWKHT